jgi:hypothetical protein
MWVFFEEGETNLTPENELGRDGTTCSAQVAVERFRSGNHVDCYFRDDSARYHKTWAEATFADFEE